MRLRMGLKCLLGPGPAIGLLFLANSALSEPSGEASGWNSKRASDPCKQIYSTYDPAVGSIDADLAYACMTSVPFDSERSVYIARQMRLFTQIYSAQTFFYDPPTPELRIKPVDLNGTFDDIEKKASSSDGYPDDYSFQVDLMKLYQSFRDGHVGYSPDCPTTFTFYHDYPLVEIYNGEDLPSIYYADTITGNEVEEIVEINGEEVHAHLEKLVQDLPDMWWIDPDARYNTLLLAKYPVYGLEYGAFAQRTFYDQESLTMKTKSGKEIKVEWKAFLTRDQFGFTDSETFAESCLDPTFSGALRARDVRRRVPRPEELSRKVHFNHKRQLGKRDLSQQGWPSPDLVMSNYQQAIYILDSETAVWGIYSFFSELYGADETDAAVDRFFEEWAGFLEEAAALLKKKGIKRILLDVSGNGGGYIVLGILNIRKFFPESKPYYGFDMRRSPALDLLIEFSADFDSSHLSLNMTKDIDNNDFDSIQEFLGPVYKYGDYFTNIGRWDVSDNLIYAGLTAPSTGDPLFDVDNIVLLSDGKCGSTCAVFSEALQNLGSKAITYNGIPDKPEHEKEMQAVGGVKGSQVWSWDEFLTVHVESFIPDYEKYDFIPKRLPIYHTSSMNLRNSYERGSDLPLEFTWQPSSAHLYTTTEMWKDKVELWKAAVAIAWDKDEKNILPTPPAAIIHGQQHGSEPHGTTSPIDYPETDGNSWSHYINTLFHREWI